MASREREVFIDLEPGTRIRFRRSEAPPPVSYAITLEILEDAEWTTVRLWDNADEIDEHHEHAYTREEGNSRRQSSISSRRTQAHRSRRGCAEFDSEASGCGNGSRRIGVRQTSAIDWSGAQVSTTGEMESQTLDLGEMVGARHLIPAGFDSAPYYRGLPDGMCPCEHWCYLVRGKLLYRFVDGESIEAEAGDVFHVRGGHLADVLEDAELIEFTRAEDYRRKAESVKQAAIEQILKAAYAAFNDRDLDRATALMHPEVDWPNAWEGGRVRGRSTVREYFERQFKAISSRVEPEGFSKDPTGSYSVRVHQVVYDAKTGDLLADSRLIHRWSLDNDNLVVRMDVVDGPPGSTA